MMTPTKETVKKEATHSAGEHAHATHATAAHATAHKAAAQKPGRYIESVGRRKTAIARVRISAGKGSVIVNGKELKKYFVLPRHAAAAVAALEQLKLSGEFDVSVHVSGGGIHAQADAIRLGISRAIIIKDAEWKPRLRAMGFVTRDCRMVERKKYGKKKARRAPQWAKR